MTAGLQVYRDDGVVLQIDESFINLQFIRKGIIQLNAKNPTNLGTNWMYNTLTVSSLTAIVAIRCPYPVYTNVSAVNNGSVTYEYFVNNAAGATLEYWIYDTASTTLGSTAGFQVFDASGVLIFDSSFQYATYLNNFTGTMPDAAIWTTNEQMDTGRTFTYSGKQVAVAQTGSTCWVNFVYLISENPNGGYDYYATTAVPCAWTPNAETVAFKTNLWVNSLYGAGAPPSNFSPYGFLIFDVTGT
ncbi:hypothetical protein [Janthinobacterium sp. MDT1-19]|uniref:hypothetical protein n=1 Tax=Janthinobacterium sp. MDT1-19 TaxID=1259339 RepID=UPI003F2536B4